MAFNLKGPASSTFLHSLRLQETDCVKRRAHLFHSLTFTKPLTGSIDRSFFTNFVITIISEVKFTGP